MNELRRSILRSEIAAIADLRERIDRIRDAEIKGGNEGRIDAIDSLSEASQALLVVIGLLLRAKRCQ